MSWLLYPLCKNTVYVLLKIFWRSKIYGAKNVPPKGGVIIAANHRSLVDPPVVGSSMRRTAHFMAKEELFRFRPFGWFISNLNAHPLKRAGDVRAFRLALNLLRSGEAVILFPEGRRSKTDELARAKPGVGLLAMSTGCPVVPVYLHNTGYMKDFRPVSVQFGEPILPENFESQQALAEAVMAAIQKMKDRLEI